VFVVSWGNDSCDVVDFCVLETCSFSRICSSCVAIFEVNASVVENVCE
jgi:hypothetical protein